ncbi:MAG: ATP-binding protein [Byssovorax sp.]
MWDSLKALFSSDFMPHGHCYFWRPELVWLEVITNLSIGLAYISISITLASLIRRVRGIPFQWVYLAFGVFIITCGFTHFMDVWVIWRPTYWLDGLLRAVTAVASVGTAVLIFPLLPKVVALADSSRVAQERGLQLEQLNAQLTALYESSQETLAEAIPQLVWTSTPDGTADYFNQRCAEYLGEKPRDASTWHLAMHSEDLARVTARWKESVTTGEVYEMEFRLRRKDGAHRWFLARALPLRDKEGRIVKWFGTCTDIHEQKHATEERQEMLQRAEAAIRARDAFLAVAAHELNTPLTPLRFEVEGLTRAVSAGRADRLTPERIAGKMAIVERQIGRLERLVSDLLDVTRIAGGRLDLKLDDVDLAEVARVVVEEHRSALERAGSTISLDLAPGVIGRWDRGRLDQVVSTLLSNAIKYGRGQPIAIEVRGDGERASITVTDRGLGVAPEHQRRIFEQFERAVSERRYGGLGLGLWIAQQVASALGGSVSLKSEPEAFSTFTVELPRRGPEAETGASGA